jgi:hypothetical protein
VLSTKKSQNESIRHYIHQNIQTCNTISNKTSVVFLVKLMSVFSPSNYCDAIDMLSTYGTTIYTIYASEYTSTYYTYKNKWQRGKKWHTFYTRWWDNVWLLLLAGTKLCNFYNLFGTLLHTNWVFLCRLFCFSSFSINKKATTKNGLHFIVGKIEGGFSNTNSILFIYYNEKIQ